MKMRIVGSLLLFSISLLSQSPEASLVSEARSFSARGAWDKALDVLQKAPKTQDPSTRELTAMALLYTSSDIDSAGNLEKAKTLMRQLVDEGGKARFIVSRGHDRKKGMHLLDATPGELTITKTYVEFQPQIGVEQPAQKWDRKDVTECAPNADYGRSSNAFHLKTGQAKDKSELHFRPYHFSKEESTLVCQLIGIQPSGKK